MRQERPVPTIKQTRPPSLHYPSQMKPSEGIVNKPSRPVNVESGPGRPSHQTQNPSAQAQRRPPAVAQNDVSVLFLGDRTRSKLWFNWWRPHYCEIFYRDWSPLMMINWRRQRSGFMKDTNKPKMVNLYVHLMLIYQFFELVGICFLFGNLVVLQSYLVFYVWFVVQPRGKELFRCSVRMRYPNPKWHLKTGFIIIRNRRME